MLIKRNQQPVWIHTERDAARAPRNPHPTRRTGNGLGSRTQSRHGDSAVSVSPPEFQLLQAKRPIQTDIGRCLALRLLELPGGPVLQVLVANRDRPTTWYEAEKALTQRQAESWARWGF